MTDDAPHLRPLSERADRVEIARAISALFEVGHVVEVRSIGVKIGAERPMTVSGYYTDWSVLERDAAFLSGFSPAVYLTLNPCLPDLLARSENRVSLRARHTTGDAEILVRRWLPLDFDPVRPAGISSSDEEHEAAIERARECRSWLEGEGFPEPILADSGNGAHLLYRIDLPNDEAGRAQVEAVLHAADERFSDDAVTVDTSVGNAARIWKLYGTLAAKGDSTPERPHRIARLLEVPDA